MRTNVLSYGKITLELFNKLTGHFSSATNVFRMQHLSKIGPNDLDGKYLLPMLAIMSVYVFKSNDDAIKKVAVKSLIFWSRRLGCRG
jgi:hypothetical protein